ncbi:hypothetical protein Tco_0707870 [Tanacetum coccineum]
MDTTEAPSLAKQSKAGKVAKKKMIKSSLQLADEFVDEGVPENEPRLDDEEAATQREIEESLKEVHNTRQGPLPPVVFREPDSGKFQLLPEVQGKGKEKVSDEQVARDLLTLQNPKKKIPAEQYIFQKRTPATSEPSGLVESSSLYAELGLTDSEMESDNEASREGQAGLDPGKQVEGQAGSDPGVASDFLNSTKVMFVHAGPNLDTLNLDVSDTFTSTKPRSNWDEEFTTTIYPSVQENLKLPTKGEVRLEEPASSAGTLSSLQNLDKELRFTNQFLAENSQPDEPEKTNNETEVQSMVTVPIHQDTLSVPLMTTPIIDFTVSQLASTMIQASILTSTATLIGELEQRMADLVEENQALEERLDKKGQDVPVRESRFVWNDQRADNGVYKFDADKADERAFGITGASNSAQDPLPPPPSPTNNIDDQPPGSAAPGSSKTAATTAYTAWITTTSRF